MHKLIAFGFALCLGGLLGVDSVWANPSCKASDMENQGFMGRVVTSGYGTRGRPVAGASTFHRAFDIRTRDNPIVGAFHGGTVATTTQKGYGKIVTVTQGNFQVFYAHVGQALVQTGQVISAGTPVGDWTNWTGIGSGAHAHIEYRLQDANGTWHKVNPLIAEKMLAAGADFNDPATVKEAIERTATECDVDADSLAAGAGAGGYYNEVDEMCNPDIKSQLVTLNNATVAFRQNAMQQVIVPPPAPSMIANTPCVSKELQRVSDKFASMPGDMMGGMMGGLGGGSGPVSGIMNKFFESGVQSINKAAENIPGMLNFQQLASEQLGNLLGGLGLGDAFSNELCGMMVDMVVNFLECQFPLEIPQMPSFDLGFGSLNDLMPQGCAGNAMREGLYKATENLPNLSQSISAPK